MDKPKFTQGQWIIGNTPHGYNANTIFDETGKSICSVFGMPLHESLNEIKKSPRFDEGVANAHLISAAPDMYAALEAAIEPIKDAISYYESRSIELPRRGAYLKIKADVMAALAKARGE